MLGKPGIAESDFKAILKNTKRAVDQLGTTVDALNEVNHLREKLNENKEQLSFDKILKEGGRGCSNK